MKKNNKNAWHKSIHLYHLGLVFNSRCPKNATHIDGVRRHRIVVRRKIWNRK